MNIKFIKICAFAAVISTLSFTSVFAAEMYKADYQAKAKEVRTEINSLNTEIKNINNENASIRNKYNTIIKSFNKNKASDVSEENIKAAKELRKSIPDIENKKQTIDSETSVQTFVKEEEYEKALERLNEILNNKKLQLDYVKAKNAVWKQIEQLIS